MGLLGIDTATLTPPNGFHLERINFRQDGGRRSCEPPLPTCNDPARLDVRDVEAAIAHPDVQAALAMATLPTYGMLNIADAPRLIFVRGDGRGFVAEVDCTTQSAVCNPTPSGVSALVDLLRGLIQQQLTDPACN